MIEKNYFTINEAAKYITERFFPCATTTLAKFVTVGGGPLYKKVGNKRVIYTKIDLNNWAESKISGPLAHSIHQ